MLFQSSHCYVFFWTRVTDFQKFVNSDLFCSDVDVQRMIDSVVCQAVSDERVEQMAMPVVRQLTNEMLGLNDHLIHQYNTQFKPQNVGYV